MMTTWEPNQLPAIASTFAATAADYLRMTADTLAALPLEKQEEVYDFARFLKANTGQTATKEKKRKGSVLNIIGLGRFW